MSVLNVIGLTDEKLALAVACADGEPEDERRSITLATLRALDEYYDQKCETTKHYCGVSMQDTFLKRRKGAYPFCRKAIEAALEENDGLA